MLTLLVLVYGCQENDPPRRAITPDSEYLRIAKEIATWIDHTQVSTPQGMIWPDDALKSDQVSSDIGVGVSGKVLFFLELYRITGDDQYLINAKRGADYLLAVLTEDKTDWADSPRGFSLYGGAPSVGFTLAEAYKVTGIQRYRAGSLNCVQFVHDNRIEITLQNYNDAIEVAGVNWNESNDVLTGTAGTGLFLLYAAQELDHSPSLQLAKAAARTLIHRAERDGQGLYWKRSAKDEFTLPNFSHGTAGIGYFLAAAHQQSGEIDFSEAAQSAVTYLRGVARNMDNAFLVPYGFPDIGWSLPYDVGWAHGAAGTARLFCQMHNITDDPVMIDMIKQCANGILVSGLPDMPKSLFGDTTKAFKIDIRFGQAGVLDFFCDLYRKSPDSTYLNFARLLADDLLEKTVADSLGARWVIERYRFMENSGEPAEFTGYLYGASGFGIALLNLHAALSGIDRGIRLPDNPF